MTFPITSSNETEGGTATAPAQEQTPAANQPSYITVDQLKQAIGELKGEVQKNFDQLYRGNQSRQDQFTAKVQKKLEAIENAAKASGIQLTDAQRKSMQDMAGFQALSEDTPSAQSGGFAPGQVQPQGNAENELVANVNKAASTMQEVWGIEISENDPENAIILAAEEGTPKEYLDATYKAIQAKLARTGTSQAAQPTAAPGSPRSPGVVKGTPISNPIQDINNPDELYQMSKFNTRG